MKKVTLIIPVIGILLFGMFVTPLLAQEEDTCVASPAPRLSGESEGQVAQTYSSLRQDVGSNVILRTMTSGETFTITGEAVCYGAHYWYPITYQGVDGWATEGSGDSYWLQPVAVAGVVEEPDAGAGGGESFGTGGALQGLPGEAIPNSDNLIDPNTGVIYTSAESCTGAPTAQLSQGAVAEVAQLYSSLRPGVHSDYILATLVPGDEVVVLDGPFCATDRLSPYNWYIVDFNGTVGWVTEGTGDVYWLEPAN